VYEMYVPHQGALAVRTVLDAPAITFGAKGQQLPNLSISASLQGKHLVLTLVNLHASQALEVEIRLHGGQAVSATPLLLQADDIHAHNTFTAPAAVAPRGSIPPHISGATLHYQLAAASVTRLDVGLA